MISILSMLTVVSSYHRSFGVENSHDPRSCDAQFMLTVWRRVFTPFQVAQLTVQTYPHSADILAMIKCVLPEHTTYWMVFSLTRCLPRRLVYPTVVLLLSTSAHVAALGVCC